MGTLTGMGKGTRAGTRTGTQKAIGTFLRDIRLQGTTFELEYLSEYETEFENNLGYESEVYIGLILEKTEAENLLLLSL
jgi:hypothetical protein